MKPLALMGRIAQLVRLRDELSGCIGCGCLSLDRCTLFNPEDTLGEQGPGPRLLAIASDEPSQ